MIAIITFRANWTFVLTLTLLFLCVIEKYLCCWLLLLLWLMRSRGWRQNPVCVSPGGFYRSQLVLSEVRSIMGASWKHHQIEMTGRWWRVGLKSRVSEIPRIHSLTCVATWVDELNLPRLWNIMPICFDDSQQWPHDVNRDDHLYVFRFS